MRPVLTAAEPRPGGRVALTFADRPGHRVTIVTETVNLDEDLAAEIAAVVLPIITRTAQKEGTAL